MNLRNNTSQWSHSGKFQVANPKLQAFKFCSIGPRPAEYYIIILMQYFNSIPSFLPSRLKTFKIEKLVEYFDSDLPKADLSKLVYTCKTNAELVEVNSKLRVILCV